MPDITHQFVSTLPDGSDPNLVDASNWNAAHVVPTGVMVGKNTTNVDGIASTSIKQYLRSNVTGYAFESPAEYISIDYAWRYTHDDVYVTGSLSHAGNKTITLSPVPLGLNATNVDHYLLIKSADGATSEVVVVTGGTAVSGAASGTITFTTIQSYVNGWTIESASAGIKEAYEYQKTLGIPIPTIFVPSGRHIVYQKVFFNSTFCLRGSSDRSTFITAATNTFDVIAVNISVGARAIEIANLAIAPLSGVFANGTATIRVIGGTDGAIRNVLLLAPFIGIDWNANLGGNVIHYVGLYMYGVQSVGLRMFSTGLGQCAAIITDFYGDGAGSTMLAIFGTIAGITATNLWFQLHAVSVYIECVTRVANEINITNSIFDGPTTTAIQVIGPGVGPSNLGTNNIRFNNILIQTIGYGAILQGTGCIYLNDITLNTGSSQPPIVIDASHQVNIENVTMLAGVGSSFVAYVALQNTCSNITLNGLTMGSLPGGSTIANGISISAQPNTNIMIMNCSTTAVTPITGVSTSGPIKTLTGNQWGFIPTIASAATITLPYYPIFNLSGTTGVTAITGISLWNGAKYTMIPSGVVTFTASATIGNTFTTTANVPVLLVVVGGKLYLR